MKRITIVRVAPVLAFLASFALMGCLGQAASSEGTDESDIVSNRAHDVANGDDNTASYNGGPARALELKTHPSSEGEGPHPEPWLDREGPHPEPWQGKDVSAAPATDPNGSGDPNKP